MKKPSRPPARWRLAQVALVLTLAAGSSQKAPAQTTAAPALVAGSASFDAVADAALLAMRRKATELGIEGAAVVAYFEGDSVQSWSSRMLVVGHVRKESTSDTDPGSNLLAIAYAKACEMADTLKDSGSKTRPVMKGEVGWQGGVIVRGKKGYLVAAFSGGKSEDDVKVSHAGVEAMQAGL